MKRLTKIICLLLATVFVITLCSCNEKKADTFNEDGQTFSLEGEKTDDSSIEKDTTDKASNSSSASSDTVTSKDSSEDIAYAGDTLDKTTTTTLGVFHMELPSNQNAYKLTNTLNKAKSGSKLKVAYIGGSVTAGSGASNPETKSWRALTTAYLKTISNGGVTELDAAIGGTASYLGAARFEKEVLTFSPDLLFIEFAINDYYNGIEMEQIKRNLEYMITSLYAKNPNADIVFALVTSTGVFGNQYKSYQKHCEVATHYNIPIVDLGGELYNLVGGSKTKVAEYLSDTVHPNDKGYQFYADTMIKHLKEWLVSGSSSAHSIPSRISQNGFSKLENHLASTLVCEGFELNNRGLHNKSQLSTYSNLLTQYPSFLTSKVSGATLTFNFTGNSFGFIGNVKEGATLTFTLDGKAVQVEGTTRTELTEYPLFSDISNGSHTVTLKAVGTPGTFAIASFVTTK